ncbi:MAG: ATP phosphoribosyltransferase [Candidatus Ranarchaeia archaeon]
MPKFSLEKNTMKLLNQSGYKVSIKGRSYSPFIDDPEIELKILRPQEIPTFVSDGSYDLGITGEDWIGETKANIVNLLDLKYGKVKLVLACPSIWDDVTNLDELILKCSKKKSFRIATEYLNIATKLIMNSPKYKEIYKEKEPLIITPWWKKGENKEVKIILSFGATEAKPPRDADAILDNTETGTTLEKNNLKILDTVMESTSRLISNPVAMENPVKKEKILDIMSLIMGVIKARSKVHIFANVSEENLPKILKILPALKSPTITPLAKKGWYSINTILEKELLVKLTPKLREYAEGIVIHEPRQILPKLTSDKVNF